MTADIQVARNGRVVVAKYTGSLTAEDISTVANFLSDSLRQAPLPIHNISDLTDVTSFPPNTLSVIRSIQKILRHPMMATFVIVTSNAFYHAMINAIVRMFPFLKVKVIKELPEAWTEIDRLLAAEVRA